MLERIRGIGLKALSVLMALMFVTLSASCGKNTYRETVSTEQTESESASETAKETTKETLPSDPWNESAVRWKYDSSVKLEIRVKPGVNYTIEDKKDDSCVIRLENGQTVSVEIWGLDYVNDFENMIGFFKSRNPEKVMVGKKTNVIVTAYDSTRTEVVSKLTDMLCLTTTGQDADTISHVFDNCLIRLNGKDYCPLDINEIFEIR